MLQLGAASLLQISASVVTNWGSYYKLGQPLLPDIAAITNWCKMYYKLPQVLQIRAIIKNWGVTDVRKEQEINRGNLIYKTGNTREDRIFDFQIVKRTPSFGRDINHK